MIASRRQRSSSRRAFLGGMAGGVGSLGLAGLLDSLESRAYAAGEAAPKRLLVLFMPNCNQQSFWVPEGGRSPQTGIGSASDFSLASGYRALESVRDQLTLIEGLSMGVEGDAHSAAVIRFMTGGGVSSGNPGDDPMAQWALRPSIDRLLVRGAPALQGARFEALDLIADDRQETSNPVYVALSWGEDGKPRLPDARPHQVYDRLFAGVDPSGGDPTRLLAREQSVLDLVTADIQDLYARVPASERPQLDSHLAGIRELEASIKAQLQNGGRELPVRPAELDATDSSNHPAIVSAHFQLIRSAFQLDLTRVVTMSFGTSNSFVDFADIIGGSQFSDDIDYPFASFGVHALAHRDEGKASPTLLAITDWYAQRTAELVELLAETIDVDGSSILDNTAVVLFSECSEGHAHDNVPVCVFGGRKLGLSGNRCLRYEDRTPSDLWTALAPAFGLDLPTFGDPDDNGAPLAELLTPA